MNPYLLLLDDVIEAAGADVRGAVMFRTPSLPKVELTWVKKKVKCVKCKLNASKLEKSRNVVHLVGPDPGREGELLLEDAGAGAAGFLHLLKNHKNVYYRSCHKEWYRATVPALEMAS